MFVSEWALEEAVVREAQRQSGEAVSLPAPRMQGGRPLFDALRERRSTRAFSSVALPLPLLSDLLWCAFGINRAATHGRTAPSAQNWQEIDIYLARADGLFLFDPNGHALAPVAASDLRGQIGLQSQETSPAVELIYVADFGRATDATEDERRMYCAANAGFIAQNVYLFCASQGLATVVRGAIDRSRLAVMMGLGREQRILLAQAVGYPAASH
jgi:SagB-type dehydrogenase family enzyme